MRFAHRTGMAVSMLTAASLVTAGAAMATTASPGSPARPGAHGARADAARIVYGFTTLDNPADPTFNQLLGINDAGVIAGYFGSGAQGHPNKGYLLARGAYINENFPGSVQTQVTGLNNRGVTVGFWSDMNNADQVNDNFGFYAINGQVFHTVNFPTTEAAGSHSRCTRRMWIRMGLASARRGGPPPWSTTRTPRRSGSR